MIRRLSIVGAAASLGVALVATPALADYPPGTATVTLFQTTLAARGAAADISFAVGCPEGATGTTSVTVTQTYDGLIATGTNVAPLTCTDIGAMVIARVTANVGGAPFTKGKATLTLRVTGCDPTGCFTTPLNQKIKLTN